MTRKPTRIRWNIIFTALCLIVFFWMADAFHDGVLYGTHGFWRELFGIDQSELLDRLQTVLIFLLFAGYAWRQSDIQDGLRASLEEAIIAHKSERVRAEAVLAAMPDAISVQDTSLKILYQNQAHKDALGEHAGEYCFTAYRQRDSICPECHLVKSFADGLPHRSETNTETALGTRYFEIFASALKDINGATIAGIESVRDITGSKLAEIKIRRLLAAVENSMDGIAILGADETYIYLNEAHAAVYGYGSPDELIGKSWHVLYDEQERQRLEPLISEGFSTSGGWRGEAVGLKKDCSRYPQEISLTLLDEGGLICVVRDISLRKKSDEEIRLLNENLRKQALDLQATNSDLEAFGYSLSHDIRSPLTRIFIAAQALEMNDERFDEEDRMLLHNIRKGCECMEEFIDAMLVLFKVTQSEICRSDVDLSSLAAEILAGLHLTQTDRQVDLNIAPGLFVACDKHLIRILLENLLGNAWKYSSKVEHARIEFGCSEAGEVPVFFVRDNGAGFDMTEKRRLFKPFQRLHNASEFPGTGVGLATVQRIVERHGGTVWSEGIIDGGASFYFTLSKPEGAEMPLPSTDTLHLGAFA